MKHCLECSIYLLNRSKNYRVNGVVKSSRSKLIRPGIQTAFTVVIFSICLHTLVRRLRTISNSSILTWLVCRIKLLRLSPQKIQVNVSVNYCHFCNLFNCESLLSLFTFYSFKKSCNHTPSFLCQVRTYVNFGKSTSMLEWFSI